MKFRGGLMTEDMTEILDPRIRNLHREGMQGRTGYDKERRKTLQGESEGCSQ